jgi:curved DNA-binding protein CbpA
MHSKSKFTAFNGDPLAVLGLEQGANAEQMRAAYLNKVKAFPPDRCPEQFEQIRDAYAYLCDPRQRAEEMLRDEAAVALFASLLDEKSAARRHVGPQPWIAAMKERRS